MGYGVVLISPPGHMAVGVKGGEGIYGTYWKYEGSKYYYVETTGDGYGIGRIPPEYAHSTATIYPMRQLPDFDISFKATYTLPIAIIFTIGSIAIQQYRYRGC